MTDARHLLIIEDDETLAGLLASHLRAHGYDVTVAPSAEAAQSLFADRAATEPDPPRHQPARRHRLVGPAERRLRRRRTARR